jgi:hypothetical protein
MLNNLTNFFNLIDKRRLKTTPELSDLIALGTPDKKYTGRYKPTFISWADLVASIVPAPGPDTNTWDLAQTAFVDASYTGGAGVIGDGNQPFTSVSAANASGASYIYLKPGNHSLIVQSNRTYYAAPGAIGTTVTDSGVTATNVNILGDLTVTATFGFNFTGSSSDVYAEVLEIDGVSAAWIDNNASLFLKVKKGIACAGNNGGGYTCRQYGGTLIIETPYFYSETSIHSPRGNSPKFILRCPDIQTLDGGPFPLGAKTIIQFIPGFASGIADLKVDLMGGTYRNLSSIATVTNGIPDSPLFYAFSPSGAPHKWSIKNGTVYAGKNPGFYCDTYHAQNMKLSYENLNVISEIEAFRTQTSTGSVGMRAKFQDCNFEGGVSNVLGNGSDIDFLRTNFKATTTATEIFNFNTNGFLNTPTFKFKDCYFTLYTPGTSETFTGFAVATLSLLNSYSTEVLGVGASDTWGGFTQVATLTLPNID